MNKAQRLEYMKVKFPQLKQEVLPAVDAVLPVTKSDIQDEMSLNDGFREHQRENKEVLTSDEVS